MLKTILNKPFVTGLIKYCSFVLHELIKTNLFMEICLKIFYKNKFLTQKILYIVQEIISILTILYIKTFMEFQSNFKKVSMEV